MSSINKTDLREAITIFRSVANNSVLKSLVNTFAFSIARFPEITLENTRSRIYNFLVQLKDIRTWEEFSDNATIVNNTFRAVYNEDIITEESFNQYLTENPLRQSSTESEYSDMDAESMGAAGPAVNTTGESKLERPMKSKSGPPPGTDPAIWEIMQEARAAGWGQPQPQLIPHKAPPMLRQTSISELPYDEWVEREVLGAAMGSSEDSNPSYSPEIAEMMMVEDPVMRQNNIAEGELWSNAAHVARARRYQEEGKDVRDDDRMTMSRLGKQGGKRKTRRKKRTKGKRKTRRKKRTKRKRKTRKRKTKRKRKTRKRKTRKR